MDICYGYIYITSLGVTTSGGYPFHTLVTQSKMIANITRRHKRKAEMPTTRQVREARRWSNENKCNDSYCDYREDGIALGCSARSGGVGGVGGGMPALMHAWESCARSVVPRRWNATRRIPSEK